MSNNPLGPAQDLDYDLVLSHSRFLKGKVLTIIDASVQDDRRNKAIKDLIKSAFEMHDTWLLKHHLPEAPMFAREELEAAGADLKEIEQTAEITELPIN